MLGNEGQGFSDALKILDGGRISIAAMALGIAQGALDCSLEYAVQREQFGRPISAFQAIRFKLADMATQIEAARALTYKVASLKKKEQPVPKWSSMAKLFASETAVRVSEEAVQIHGGYGFQQDHDLFLYFKQAKESEEILGDADYHLEIVAKELGL